MMGHGFCGIALNVALSNASCTVLNKILKNPQSRCSLGMVTSGINNDCYQQYYVHVVDTKI